MSHTHQDGHGRCGACGDDGENRRARETAWADADDRNLPAELAAIAEDREWEGIDRWDGCSEYCCGGPFADPYEAGELLDRYGWRPLRVNFLEVARVA